MLRAILVKVMPELLLDKSRTALVVIDLQKGIAAQTTKPYPAHDVIQNAARLVHAFRKNGMQVFLVHVMITKETMIRVTSDQSLSGAVARPPDWS